MPVDTLINMIETQSVADAFRPGWSRADWRIIEAGLSPRKMQAGEVLIEYRSASDEMFLIENGTFQVYLPTPSTARRPVAILRAGSVVGEPAMFASNPRMAQVDAMTPAVVWGLSRDALQALSLRYPAQCLAWLRACGAVMATRMLANIERGMPSA